MLNQHRYRLSVLLVAAALLAGCTSTGQQRIGADDTEDPARAQLVALDSTGKFFAEDILKGAAVGAVGGAALGGLIGRDWQSALIGAAAGAATGAAGGYLSALRQRSRDQATLNASLASDLQRENAELDRTQLAFDQLMDARFTQAQQIREAYASGRLPRGVAEAQMADLRARTARDIQLARTIDQRIGARGAEFDTAVESVAPGVKQAALADKSAAPVLTARSRAPVALRLRPDPGAPEIGRLPPQESIQLRPAGRGYALVQTAAGRPVGYAAVSTIEPPIPWNIRPPRSPRNTRVTAFVAEADAVDAARHGDIRSLAASNIARREAFSASLAIADQALSGGRMDLDQLGIAAD